jgi:hypothetical protein
MASATGIPQTTPDEIAHRGYVHDPSEEGLAEDAPLLGDRGAASQPEGWALGWNLTIGIYFTLTPPVQGLANTMLQARRS